MRGWQRRFEEGGPLNGDEANHSDYNVAVMTPKEAADYAQSIGQHKGNQVSGVNNGLAYATYDDDGNLVADNIYALDDVVVRAPDLRVVKALNGGRNIPLSEDVKRTVTNSIENGNDEANGDDFSIFPDWMRRIFGHPVQTTKALINTTARYIPFLKGESGSYVKDLSDSHIARITPETENVKSILGNTFIEKSNTNTIRPAGQFKVASPDERIGDWYTPLSNFKLYMGIENGKLKVDSIANFDDQTIVTPVRNKTDLTYSLIRQDAAKQVEAARKEKWWRQSPHPDLPQEAVNDSIAKYSSLSSNPIGFVNKSGVVVPMSGLTRDKSLLVAPNGNAMFLNDLDKFSARQDSLVNAFLKKNNGAYPVQIDNGRYRHYLEGDGANYDSYMAADLYREPKDVWAFGEVE